MVIDLNNLLIALITGIPIIATAYWGYKKSRRVDELSAKSGAVTESRAGVEQVISGMVNVNAQLQQLLDKAQEDNEQVRAEFRTDIRHLIEDNRLMVSRLEACNSEKEEMRRELNSFRRKYGNGETPAGGTPNTP